MKHALIIGLVFSVFLSYSQDKTDCKVLLTSISGKYKGECKKGLAHGQGTAEGKDHYTGRFKKGYPHGKGVYTWANGDVYEGSFRKGKKHGNGVLKMAEAEKDSILEGVWENDLFVKEVQNLSGAYQVLSAQSVERYKITKKSGGLNNTIEFVFNRGGNISRQADGMLLQGSSGASTVGFNFTGFENVLFPFECSVFYRVPNKMNSMTIEARIRIKFNEPGDWLVTLYY